jgi:collagenase-like PrtC family protease
MKILAPLARIDEVEPLILSGADEFYCGLMNKKGALNDRPNTAQFNFANAAELGSAVKVAHKFGKRVFLAINAQTVDFKEAFDQVKAALSAGIEGLILSNPLLIKRIKRMHPKLELNASCLCAVFNSESVNFFKKLGIKRFHLPRQLGLEQLKLIHDNISVSVR